MYILFPSWCSDYIYAQRRGTLIFIVDSLVSRSSMKENLGRIETWTYAGIWTCSCVYAVYHVYWAADEYFRDYDDAYNDFSSGWDFINRKQDTSDEEWKMWIPLVFRLVPWIIIQVFISQCLKKFAYTKKTLCIWYMTISLTFLWYYYGFLSTLCTLLLPCISCLLTSLKSKLFSWIVHSSTLTVIYYASTSEVLFKNWLKLSDENYYTLTTAICWIQLRSLSFSIDSIEAYKQKNTYRFFNDLLQGVSYCLYLPTLFLGPVILYDQFTNSIKKPFSKWNQERLLNIFFNLTRYTFWMFFTGFYMHYVYLNALRFHPKTVRNLGPWAFYGLGYCMGQHFLNKYVVIYGLTSTTCRAEDIDAPPQPKCISRIHLYSDMWKHFDRGLYKFLVRYIYVPCYNPKTSFRKFCASAITFIFIYLWHGMHLFVFIWAFLNFVGIVIETIVKSYEIFFYKKVLQDKLSPQNKQRLECALATPLLVLSSLSSFYFFAGEEVGHIYVSRIFQESWKTILVLFFILYCCCQTSSEIKRLELKKNSINKDIKMKIN